MTYGGAGHHPQQPGWQPPGPPPQGMPPQGTPYQGAPQAMPPQGMPPQAMPPQGAPPQGGPYQGMPPGAQPPGVPPRQQPYPPRPAGETPLTLPGWGAIPALLGVVLAAVGLFALKWAGDATFADLNKAIRQAAAGANGLSGNDQWIKIYFPQGVIIALALAAIPPALWSLGSIRSVKGAKSRGGLTKKSLMEGRTGPTRTMLSVLAGLCLLYHVISLLILTDGGKHLDGLGPGPWLLVAGTALSVAGAVIGPRVPGNAARRPY
ncbi:hypothetical protein [Amycolatopsis samaneae]|uniref:DUF1648 domain-containing protein n=1 Tax=Amycolatopsis samaneae TaxID=664691 RepID=A0ABW5G9X8_9PSEU